MNFLNVDAPLLQDGPSKLHWKSVTARNMAGLDMIVRDAEAGEIKIVTGPASVTLAINEIQMQDYVIETGGLGRRIRLFRLPEQGSSTALEASLEVKLMPGRDNPIFARIIQEDGHQAWSSPIYFIS